MENMRKLGNMENKMRRSNRDIRNSRREQRQEGEKQYTVMDTPVLKEKNEFSVRRGTTGFLSKVNKNRFSPKHIVIILQNIKDKSLKTYQHNDSQRGSRLLTSSNRNQETNCYSLKMLKENNCHLTILKPDDYHSTQKGLNKDNFRYK